MRASLHCIDPTSLHSRIPSSLPNPSGTPIPVFPASCMQALRLCGVAPLPAPLQPVQNRLAQTRQQEPAAAAVAAMAAAVATLSDGGQHPPSMILMLHPLQRGATDEVKVNKTGQF